MKTLLRALLRLFPEDVGGLYRTEMEETFLDGYRASPSPFRFALRELRSILRNGVAVRLGIWMGPRWQGVGPEGEPVGSTFRGRIPWSATAAFSGALDDLRMAVRRLLKSPGFLATSALTLGVGIGATVAMFSILQAALLRALPYPEPEELVLGRATFRGETNPWCSFPDFLSYKEGSQAFEAFAAVLPSLQRYTLTGSDAPERVGIQWVTADFFQALDVAPALGRVFFSEEGEFTGSRVVVFSYGLWR